MATKKDITTLNPKEYIIIKGARMHNLKGIDVALPRNKFIVITGLSGSGKSSLAFDTLYAEGQRRYVESLSAYARQFLGRLEKPKVDYIKGISPAIAIEQKVISRNPRSTVGTITEIYDYLKLLYARVGKTYSPISGKIVKRDSITDVVDFVNTLSNDTKCLIVSKLIVPKDRTLEKHLELLNQQGFARILVNNQITKISKRPFIFKLEGIIEKATIHIVNLPKGSKVSSPDDAHQGQINYHLQNEQVEIIGFFSTEHKAILTHHDTFLHMHLITKDKTKMGHLDEVLLKNGIKLYLPVN